MTVVVRRPGVQCLLMDLGRPGHATLGVSRGGAFDRGALRRANRLVGNREDAPALECLLGGTELLVNDSVLVAVCGAHGTVTLDGRPLATEAAIAVAPGAVLTLGAVSTGLRRYVAVRGGLAAPSVLGSCSYDTLTGIGPDPLKTGDVAPIATAHHAVPQSDQLPWSFTEIGPTLLMATAGPRLDRLTGAAQRQLRDTVWTVASECDRVGVRLDGPALPRRADTELPSEGLRPGSVQIAGDGRPVIFGPDHPVTGGYPVAAVLTPAAFDALAQLGPGRRVRLDVAEPPPWAGRPIA